MSGPLIGIWWDDGKSLVVSAHSHTENATCVSGLVDSNLSHADEWNTVAARLGRNTDDEYFSVPRGRVLLEIRSMTGVILHGPVTTCPRLERIARRFGLKVWKSEIDTHYFMGRDADALFADEE